MEPSKICLLTANNSSDLHIKGSNPKYNYEVLSSHQFIQLGSYQHYNLDDCLPVLVSVTEGFSHFSRTEDWKVLMKKAQKKRSHSLQPSSFSSSILRIITHYRIHCDYHVWLKAVLM